MYKYACNVLHILSIFTPYKNKVETYLGQFQRQRSDYSWRHLAAAAPAWCSDVRLQLSILDLPKKVSD